MKFISDQPLTEHLPLLQGGGGANLLVNETMWKSARGNKEVGFVAIKPITFLRLTTPSDDVIRSLCENSLTLDQYNDFVLVDDPEDPLDEDAEFPMNLAPFLTIDLSGEPARVDAHEGRHRSCALMEADPDAYMWVGLGMRPKGNAIEMPRILREAFGLEYPRDLPPILECQYTYEYIEMEYRAFVGIDK